MRASSTQLALARMSAVARASRAFASQQDRRAKKKARAGRRLWNFAESYVIPSGGDRIDCCSCSKVNYRIASGVVPLGNSAVDQLTVDSPRIELVAENLQTIRMRHARFDVDKDYRNARVPGDVGGR